MRTSINDYPKPCRENLTIILDNVKTDTETAYSMMLMTAALMDLCPADPRVAEIILDDCKGMRVVKKS